MEAHVNSVPISLTMQNGKKIKETTISFVHLAKMMITIKKNDTNIPIDVNQIKFAN